MHTPPLHTPTKCGPRLSVLDPAPAVRALTIKFPNDPGQALEGRQHPSPNVKTGSHCINLQYLMFSSAFNALIPCFLGVS